MTNQEIILREQINLMKEGKIGSTGRMIKIILDKQEMIIKEPEPIHTYATWKQLGYQVQKGQKAVASFMIWKFVSKEKEPDQMTGNPILDTPDEKMFMKKSNWFTFSQVQEIKKA